MSSIDERLAAIGVDGNSTEPLELDSLARFELWMLLEEVTAREIPLELVTSIETSNDVHHWLSYLSGTE
jgi:acyl carrier protein